jgi:hypothetical protein
MHYQTPEKDLPTEVEIYHLSESERRDLEDRAMKENDGAAAWRLADYYGFSNGNEELFKYWVRRAAALGHPPAVSTLKHSSDGYFDEHPSRTQEPPVNPASSLEEEQSTK